MAAVISAPGEASVGGAKNAAVAGEHTLTAVESGETERTTLDSSESAPERKEVALGNGHQLRVTSPEKAPGMSDELIDIFNKLIDDQDHLDMRNVTTLIWVNRKRPAIVEAIVELLIGKSNERRVFNGIEFYLPQLAHMIVHLDVDLPSSALEQFALVVCQQSLHVALQLNWILVAALEDYHAEMPDGSPNKKANTVYFNRCAKLLQNVERIIALGAPSATGLEELYKTGQLSRHEVESRTIAERKRQAEKVISSPKRGIVPVAEEIRIKGWLWHKRWYKRGFPHHSRWIRRWFEVEDRVLYCYSDQDEEGNKVKRAAVLYQSSVKDCQYKDGKYDHYFEVHSPMGVMRLRAEDAAGKVAWVTSLQKQAEAMPAVAHLYAHDGQSSSSTGGITANRTIDPPRTVASTAASGGHREARPSSICEGDETRDSDPEQEGEKGVDGGNQEVPKESVPESTGEADEGEAGVGAVVDRGGVAAAAAAAGKLLAGTARERQSVMSMSTVVLQEAKRNRRFKFFSDERKFVSDLTDICEALRFVEDRSKRGVQLEDLLTKVHVPECAYLPLCRSTEPFQRVIKITANEAKAFSTKERVPAMVTFETERTWPQNKRPAAGQPLDVASFLHFVYGFHAPMHQDQQRYSSLALRGGEESIMQPDLLAVSEAKDGEEIPTPGHRQTRSGSFRFRAGSKGLAFPHMPPVHLPGNFSTVWRDKPAGADAAKAKEMRGTKSPFRHNLSSLSSAFHARASSIRHVKIPGVRQSITKKGPGHTPGSVVSVSSVGDDKDGEFVPSALASTTEGAMALPGGVEGIKVKNVAWEDAAREIGEKEAEGDETAAAQQAASKVSDSSAAAPSMVVAYSGEAKEEEREETPSTGANAGANGGAGNAGGGGEVEGKGLERIASGEAIVVEGRSLDKALGMTTSPRSRSVSGGVVLEEVSLADGNPRMATLDGEDEFEDPSTPCKAFGESMAKKAHRIRKQSEEGSREGWSLQRLIVKSNDDVRQEVFIMQLISFYKEVFEREELDLWLKPYSILSTAKTTGLIEVLNQATSMDGLKKSEGYPGSLLEHFYAVFGAAGSPGFKAAQRRFARSLAGYSVVSYLLRIKDRHNGNVMLDSDGRIVHIDFGFVLGSAPGKKFSMERAAFKLTDEYVAVLGGKDSELYEEYVGMFVKGLMAARKYATVTITMLEIMMFQSEFPCFEYMGDAALKGFKNRLMLRARDSDVIRRARRMVDAANGHWGTCLYDKFQLWSNGIMP